MSNLGSRNLVRTVSSQVIFLYFSTYFSSFNAFKQRDPNLAVMRQDPGTETHLRAAALGKVGQHAADLPVPT